jgi:hypothetical protein
LLASVQLEISYGLFLRRPEICITEKISYTKQEGNMNRFISSALVSAAVAIAGISVATAASATTPGPVQISGNTYHVALCGAVAPGMARCHAHIVTDARGNPLTRAAPVGVAGRNTVTQSFVPSGFGATDLRTAYGITANGSPTTTVAIVDAFGYNNAEADMGVYRAQFGLPACTTANSCFAKVNQNGQSRNYPPQDSGWAGETALDLDMVSAMCPGCHILLVEANTNGNDNLAQSVNTAVNLGATIVSNSYGGGEGGSQTDEPSYNHTGVIITASSGDDGFGTQFPASSPHVVAVGGTHMVRSATTRGFTETVWTGAGSGCSTIYTKPAWQTDALCTKRMEADVSAVADPNTGVAFYAPSGFGFKSAWGVVGGTSVAAPLIAGVYGSTGNAHTQVFGSNLYAAPSTAFNDVTSGHNGTCGGTYFCTAGAGYDGPTGLGTPAGASAF